MCGSCIWLPRAERFSFLKVQGHPNPGSTGLKVSPHWGMALWLRKGSAIGDCKTLGFQGSSLETSLSHVSIHYLFSRSTERLSSFTPCPKTMPSVNMSYSLSCLPLGARIQADPFPQLYWRCWWNPPMYKSLVGRDCPLVATNWEWLWTSIAQPRTKQSLAGPSHQFSDCAFGFGLFFSLCEENK